MERTTRQRDAIRRTFEIIDRPLSPSEVLDNARDEVPRLGIATVYRTLRALCDENWLTAVEIPGEAPRYERAHKAHHHHFVCRHCRQVFEVAGCADGLSELTPEGFVLESHDIVLAGLCSACAGASSTRKPQRFR
jgi:Fur family transcriptional regulator, ferric uptake regulator